MADKLHHPKSILPPASIIIVKYPLLHHASYLVIGLLSLPLAFLLLFYYFSPDVLFSLLAGALSGIGANEAWFRLIDRNFSLYRKIMKTKKGYRRIIGDSTALFALYGITSLLSALIFFSWGTAALLAFVSGLCLTGLMYYRSAKKFYKRL